MFILGNACGTIAVVHALANNEEKLNLSSDSALAKFLQKTKNMTPEQRSDELVVSESIAEAHKSSAEEGQTKTPRYPSILQGGGLITVFKLGC